MARDRTKYVKRFCKYTAMRIDVIGYKDIDLIKMSLSERGKILPRRLTGNAKKYQEQLEIAVKRARHMALIPYVVNTSIVVAPANRDTKRRVYTDKPQYAKTQDTKVESTTPSANEEVKEAPKAESTPVENEKSESTNNE